MCNVKKFQADVFHFGSKNSKKKNWKHVKIILKTIHFEETVFLLKVFQTLFLKLKNNFFYSKNRELFLETCINHMLIFSISLIKI